MDLIAEINYKYMSLETEVDKKLEMLKREEDKLFKVNSRLSVNGGTNLLQPAAKLLSYEDALARNTNILRSLEIAKARLRSRYTFSPIEEVLEQALNNYKYNLE